jgi:outer membrane protein assembly factor BamE (lipoprotein component of BamABCDE complex)
MASGDNGRFITPARLALALGLAATVAGCTAGSIEMPRLGYDGTVQRGYQTDDKTLAELKPGVTKEKTLAALGTPSTTSTVGGDAWYYISQTVNRKVAFMAPKVTDQRVLAVYFKGGKLERVANYGLQDGQVFDYLSRTTPTAGGDTGFVQNMLTNLLKFQ